MIAPKSILTGIRDKNGVPIKIGDTVISTYEDNISRQITEVIDVKYAIQYMPLYPGEQEGKLPVGWNGLACYEITGG